MTANLILAILLAIYAIIGAAATGRNTAPADAIGLVVMLTAAARLAAII